jgi:hypothetical protein
MRALHVCLAVCLAFAHLLGCTPGGSTFQREAGLSNDVGVIYVYRPLSSLFGRGEDPYVTIAGKQMGRLKAGGYFKFIVPIGEHKVTVNQSIFLLPTWPESVEVAVASATSTYVKVDQRITDLDFSSGATATQQVSIEEVSSPTGQNEIAALREDT